MAAVSLFWDFNMAAVTSCENTLYMTLQFQERRFTPLQKNSAEITVLMCEQKNIWYGFGAGTRAIRYIHTNITFILTQTLEQLHYIANIFEKQIKISKSEGKERKKRDIQNKTKISESNQTY